VWISHLLSTDVDKHEAIKKPLSDLKDIAFGFERHGSRIIFYH
jgi:hypothetical protein